MRCPNCQSDLEGELIYATFLRQYGDEQQALHAASSYGATKNHGHWNRATAVYDRHSDTSTHWRCPDCGHQWQRN